MAKGELVRLDRLKRAARKLGEKGQGLSDQAGEIVKVVKKRGAKGAVKDVIELSRGQTKKLAEDARATAKMTYQDAFCDTSPGNWYRRAAKACEGCSDAFLRNEKNASKKIVRIVVGKLGGVGTSASIFGLATIVGTASTGTAISSLSGAAFTSAAAAWIGGSVAMGTAIIGVAAVAGGVGAALGEGWVLRRYVYGKKREKTELELQEQRVVDACLVLAAAFREQEAAKGSLDPQVANALYGEALRPLIDELFDIYEKTNSWPSRARRRLEKAIGTLKELTDWLGHWLKKRPNMATGIVSAVFIQLFSEDLPDFSGDELLVLDAIRRSRNDLRKV